MAKHGVPHGEESTYRANKGKQTAQYEGKHRKEEEVTSMDIKRDTTKKDRKLDSRLRIRKDL